jgi:hypothetical protein
VKVPSSATAWEADGRSTTELGCILAALTLGIATLKRGIR